MVVIFLKPSGRAEHRTSWLYLVPPFTLPLGYAASLVEERYELFLKVPNFLKKNAFIHYSLKTR